MTTLESHSLVLQHFLEKHYLNYNQIIGLLPKDENQDNGVAAVMSSLEDLVNNNILYKHQDDPKNNKSITWVLKKSLALCEQNILIDGITSLRIAEVINNFSETIDNEGVMCNPLQIQCKDIQLLLEVIDMLSSSNEEESESPKDNKTK